MSEKSEDVMEKGFCPCGNNPKSCTTCNSGQGKRGRFWGAKEWADEAKRLEQEEVAQAQEEAEALKREQAGFRMREAVNDIVISVFAVGPGPDEGDYEVLFPQIDDLRAGERIEGKDWSPSDVIGMPDSVVKLSTKERAVAEAVAEEARRLASESDSPMELMKKVQAYVDGL